MKRPDRSLLSLLVLHALAIGCLARNLTLNVNLKKPIAVTDEKFLSFTIDPAILLAGNALSTNFERSVILAKALSPAYIRLGGPRSSLRTFGNENSQGTEDHGKIVLSESDLVRSHHWAEKAGLHVITCVSPDDQRVNSGESEGAREIISFGDHAFLNTSWQLGYECQSGCDLTADDFAKQTLKLRKLLNEFPRYSDSMVVGPDVIAYASEKQQDYLREYLKIAGPALSAITWHPDLASVTSGKGGVFIPQDNLEKDKEELFDAIGRYVANRPLWIAESKPEVGKNLYIGALVLARRLGNAAKLNVNVIMRQPTDLTKPTPDYWVSLLYKTLVGPEVFDTKIHTTSESHVYLYCHCTKASSRYKRGSVVIFGVNMSPENAEIDLKGAKITTVHRYMLAPSADTPNAMFAETVLLNNRSLALINDTIPDIDPAISNEPNGLNLVLPSAGIGFWVFPNLKIKSCMASNGESKKETFSGIRGARDPSEAENIQVRIGRSVQDPVSGQSEEGTHISSDLMDSASTLLSEIKVLRDFVKKKLDDYDSRFLLQVRGLSDSRQENGQKSDAQSTEIVQQLQDDVRTVLKRFYDWFMENERLSTNDERLKVVKDSIVELVENVKNLISQMQTTLTNAERKTDRGNRMKLVTTVKHYLKTLYELLVSEQLGESIDSIVKKAEQKSVRSKRSLPKETIDPLNPKRIRKRAWGSDLGESGIDRTIKHRLDVTKEVRPKLVGQRGSDNEEDTFYGFYKMEPLTGFPNGDVFYPSEHSPRNTDYDHARSEDIWSEDETDYPFYETTKSIGGSRTLNDRSGRSSSRSEPGAVPIYGSKKNERFGYAKQFGIAEIQSGENYRVQEDRNTWGSLNDRYVPDNFPNNRKDSPIVSNSNPARTTYANPQASDLSRQGMKFGARKTAMSAHGLSTDLKGLDFSIAGSFDETGRFRRESKNVHDILDQEMIDEDDANSKDCDCRVLRRLKNCDCRSKRSADKSVKPGTPLIPISMDKRTLQNFETGMDPPILSDIEDVEIFSDITGPPMERLDVRTEIAAPKFKRDPITSFQTEVYLEDVQRSPAETEIVETHAESDIPVLGNDLESFANRKNLHSEIMSPNPLSSLNFNGDDDPDPPVKKTVRRVADTFFRGQSETEGEKEPAINTEENTSADQESSTVTVDQKVTEKIKKAEKITRLRTKSSYAALKTTTSSDETVTEESMSDYTDDVAGSIAKQEVAEEEVSTEASPTVGAANPRSPTGIMKNRKRKKTVSEKRSKTGRSRESEASKRLRTLKALRELLREYRGKHTPNPAAKSKQIQKLRGKLRDKRQMVLQEYPEQIPDVTDNAENDEKKSLKRREVSEMPKESDDVDDFVDREDSADDSEMDESSSDESVETIEVPVNKIVTARHIRKKIFHPTSQHGCHDSRILTHPGLMHKKKKIIKLKHLHDKLAATTENLHRDYKGKDKSYFALVEDLHRPRIFYYHEKPGNEERPSEQVSSPHLSLYDTEYTYDQPRQQTRCHNVKALRYSDREDEEELDGYSGNRKIYILDPSEYRGGDPHLRLYRGPSESRSNSKIGSKKSHDVVCEPIAHRTFKTRQTEQYTRDDEIPSQDYDDLSRTTAELLNILINELDAHTVEELLRQIKTENNAMSVVEQVPVASISEETEEELPEEDDTEIERDETAKRITESKESPESSESYEIVDTRYVRDQRESPHTTVSIEEGPEIERNNTSFEAEVVPEYSSRNDSREENPRAVEEKHLRKRRDTSAWSTEEHATWLPPFLMRKIQPRAIQKTARNNYLHLKETPEEIADENTSKLIKILKGSNFYKVSPVKRVYDVLSPSVTTDIDRSYPELLRLVIPSRSSEEYLPIEVLPIADTEHSYNELSVNYQESEEKGSELEKSEVGSDDVLPDYREENVPNILEAFDTDEEEVPKSEESDENVNLEELLLSDEPGLLMVLPLANEHGRHRRETVKPEEIGETSNTEKAQPLDLQHLDESLAPRSTTLGSIDDIEKSLVQKAPLKKYTAKENIDKKKNFRKSKKIDDGLPSLIEKSIPKLGNVVVDSLKKAQNFTGSVEKLIENLDEKYDESLHVDRQSNSTDPGSIGVTENIFRNAIMNVKKFFMLLGGINRLILV